jgi:hypothetical protein
MISGAIPNLKVSIVCESGLFSLTILWWICYITRGKRTFSLSGFRFGTLGAVTLFILSTGVPTGSWKLHGSRVRLTLFVVSCTVHKSFTVGLSRQCHSRTITTVSQQDYHESVTVGLSRQCHSGTTTTVSQWDYHDSFQWDFHDSVTVGLSRQCHSGIITTVSRWDYHDSVTVGLSRQCSRGIISTVWHWDFRNSVTVGLWWKCYISDSQVMWSGMRPISPWSYPSIMTS